MLFRSDRVLACAQTNQYFFSRSYILYVVRISNIHIRTRMHIWHIMRECANRQYSRTAHSRATACEKGKWNYVHCKYVSKMYSDLWSHTILSKKSIVQEKSCAEPITAQRRHWLLFISEFRYMLFDFALSEFYYEQWTSEQWTFTYWVMGVWMQRF